MDLSRLLPSRLLRRFLADERGTISVEAAMMLPVLATFYVATFVWFDAYRAQNTNLKAGYTISDMLSRETVPVDDNYLNGLNKILDYLTYSRHNTYLRVTSIKCVDNCDNDSARDLEICWSWATTGRNPHDQASFASFEPNVPLMPEGDTVLMTETFMAYEPPFNVGIQPQFFEFFVITRPRFAPEVEKTAGNGTDSCY